MKTSLPQELADKTEKDLEDISSQLKGCTSHSNIEFLTTLKTMKTMKNMKNMKNMKTKVRIQKSQSSTSDQCNRLALITHTEQGINSRLQPESIFDETANSLMATKSVASNGGGRLTLINKKGVNIKPRKKKWNELRDVLMNQKVNGLKETFCAKIKRNNPYSQPLYYEFQEDTFEKSIFDTKGIQLKQNLQKVISLLFMYNIISSIFIFTLSMVFPTIRQQLPIRIIQYFGAGLFFIEMVLNFVTIRFSLGRKLQTIKQISSDYMRHKFPIDCINIFIIVIYLSTEEQIAAYFRIVTLLKLQDCMERLQKLQNYFIQNYYNEQYWSLFKVFLFNFCFAHMLAILLIGMANVNPNSNWIINKNLMQAPWFERYVWSYYWGTTIMLTIGFGDLLPVCYEEALCMIFIQTISCMVLAYNINCVGSLITNIRSQDLEKSKNMKIFKKLSDKHGIDESLSQKINNYIQEHTNIKKLFNIEEEVQFVSKLPTAYRTDYLKQANKTIFQKLFFFNHLMEKTLFSLAQKIQMKITHPQEAILTTQKNFDIFILKNGEIGYTSRKINRKFNSNVFDRMKVLQTSAPFLLNTNFITKKRSSYGIKSLVYSVLYYLDYDNLIEILKETHLDYELYCRQRDKNKNKIDQFQVFPCQYCNQKHTKFSCPKLHFIPIEQQIIYKYLNREKNGKNSRLSSFERQQSCKESSLARYLFNKEIYDQRKEEEATQTTTKRLKKQKYIIDQLRFLENDETKQQSVQFTQKNFKQMNNMQLITKLQTKFFQNTTQLIKVHINKTLGQGKGDDDVWLIDLDKMKNYKDYFAENNACNLTNKFSVEDRSKRKIESKIFKIIANTFTGGEPNSELTSNDKSESMILPSSNGKSISFNI